MSSQQKPINKMELMGFLLCVFRCFSIHLLFQVAEFPGVYKLILRREQALKVFGNKLGIRLSNTVVHHRRQSWLRFLLQPRVWIKA